MGTPTMRQAPVAARSLIAATIAQVQEHTHARSSCLHISHHTSILLHSCVHSRFCICTPNAWQGTFFKQRATGVCESAVADESSIIRIQCLSSHHWVDASNARMMRSCVSCVRQSFLCCSREYTNQRCTQLADLHFGSNSIEGHARHDVAAHMLVSCFTRVGPVDYHGV